WAPTAAQKRATPGEPVGSASAMRQRAGSTPGPGGKGSTSIAAGAPVEICAATSIGSPPGGTRVTVSAIAEPRGRGGRSASDLPPAPTTVEALTRWGGTAAGPPRAT